MATPDPARGDRASPGTRTALAEVEGKPSGDASPGGKAWLVHAVVPCFNRALDLQNLLEDLAEVSRRVNRERAAYQLRVIVVDNASDPPLDRTRVPGDVRATFLRLQTNTGGSGGFNAGLSHALARVPDGSERDLLWLLDSDARVLPDTLDHLVAGMHDGAYVAIGSALRDPRSGEIFECGGHVQRSHGELAQFGPSVEQASGVREVEYVAACSMLVRAEAVRRAGLMPDTFVNGDDVGFCLKLARVGKIGVNATSIAIHPHPDKARSWDRYYVARNTFGPMRQVGLGPIARARRLVREFGRAMSQIMIGRDDLALLHLRGIRDAARGRVSGPADPPPQFDQPTALRGLHQAIRSSGNSRRIAFHPDVEEEQAEQVRVALGLGEDLDDAGVHEVAYTDRSLPARLVFGPAQDMCVVSGRGKASTWLSGRSLVQIVPGGFVLRSTGRVRAIARVVRMALHWAIPSARLIVLGTRSVPSPAPPFGPGHGPGKSLTLSIIVLSYNRKAALERTLDALLAEHLLQKAEIIVVDNASTDGSAEWLAKEHPRLKLVALPQNRGVAGFNEGVRAAGGDVVLILDDDAVPAPGALEDAMKRLEANASLAAVSLHPRHPMGGASEWPFAESQTACDDWPVMGCGNIIRRSAWEAVGGYDEGFFLYRNDVDMAMKLLARGWGVHFDPKLVVLHDSPAAAKKSKRWFTLATRNWMWLSRRHGQGWTKVKAIVMAWAWAHRLAGLHITSQIATISGAVRGLLTRVPHCPVSGDGSALAKLLSLRSQARRKT